MYFLSCLLLVQIGAVLAFNAPRCSTWLDFLSYLVIFLLVYLSLHQNVTHGFDVFVSIIWRVLCLVSTRVGIIRISSCTKPDSGITTATVISVVTNDTDSCLRMETGIHNIEPFLVTVVLQGSVWANQRVPHVTAQWGSTVMPVSDQWVQRVGVLVDDSVLGLVADLHSKADLGERCAPVGW